MGDSDDSSSEDYNNVRTGTSHRRGQNDGKKRIEILSKFKINNNDWNNVQESSQVNSKTSQIPRPKPRYLRNTEASRRRALVPSLSSSTKQFEDSQNNGHNTKSRRRSYRGGIEGGGGKRNLPVNPSKNPTKNPIKYPLIFYSSNYKDKPKSSQQNNKEKHCCEKSKNVNENPIHNDDIQSGDDSDRKPRIPGFRSGLRTPVNSPCTLTANCLSTARTIRDNSSSSSLDTTSTPEEDSDDPKPSTKLTLSLIDKLDSRSAKEIPPKSSQNSVQTGLTTFIHISPKFHPFKKNSGQDDIQPKESNCPKQKLRPYINWPKSYPPKIISTTNYSRIENCSSPPRATAYIYYEPRKSKTRQEFEVGQQFEYSNNENDSSRPKTPPRPCPPSSSPYFEPFRGECEGKVNSRRGRKIKRRNNTSHDNDNKLEGTSLVGEIVYNQNKIPKTRSKVINGQYVIVSRHSCDQPLTTMKKFYKSVGMSLANICGSGRRMGQKLLIDKVIPHQESKPLKVVHEECTLEIRSCPVLKKYPEIIKCKQKKRSISLPDCRHYKFKGKNGGQLNPKCQKLQGSWVKKQSEIERNERIGHNLIPWGINMGRAQNFTTYYLEVDFSGKLNQYRQGGSGVPFTSPPRSPPPCQQILPSQPCQQQQPIQQQWPTFDSTPSNHLTGCGTGHSSQCVSNQCQPPPCVPPPPPLYQQQQRYSIPSSSWVESEVTYCVTGPGSCHQFGQPFNSSHFPDRCQPEGPKQCGCVPRNPCPKPPVRPRRTPPPRPPPPRPPKTRRPKTPPRPPKKCVPTPKKPCPKPSSSETRVGGGGPRRRDPYSGGGGMSNEYLLGGRGRGGGQGNGNQGGIPGYNNNMGYPGMPCMFYIPMCPTQCPPQCGPWSQNRGKKRKRKPRDGFCC